MKFKDIELKEIKLLGKGKSGYSYLVVDEFSNKYVLKKIHHEPIDYYNFSNKFKSEIDDYHFLKDIIDVPELIDVDYENETILKEYIDGYTISQMIERNFDISRYLFIVESIAQTCYQNGINIDYYPTNFIPYKDTLYYIDYEKNVYDEKWNFSNWGVKFWTNIKT